MQHGECREREKGVAGRRLWGRAGAWHSNERKGGRVKARAGCCSCSHQGGRQAGRQVQDAMQLKRGKTLGVMGSALKTRPRNLVGVHQSKAMQGLSGKVGRLAARLPGQL
jgi:hypothetical protein